MRITLSQEDLASTLVALNYAITLTGGKEPELMEYREKRFRKVIERIKAQICQKDRKYWESVEQKTKMWS